MIQIFNKSIVKNKNGVFLKKITENSKKTLTFLLNYGSIGANLGGMFMIIGITGNSKDGKLKLSKYLNENYSFKYVDVDKIFDDILNQHNIKDNWQMKSSLILKIRNEIDEKLNSILDNMNENDVIALDYSLL